ncbi:MAG: hypothetical protein JNM42_00670 [Propionivibrio sp.]|uniref:hypothetical protein n=1 Tax=Propionivibrio sp. TaxID=2212460 RepID=UPI001A603C2D|nr:hypothetical protein [Propionivibrio sp.]MBL8412934.1 hypothetical protein [Propionivibrio sp.]
MALLRQVTVVDQSDEDLVVQQADVSCELAPQPMQGNVLGVASVGARATRCLWSVASRSAVVRLACS